MEVGEEEKRRPWKTKHMKLAATRDGLRIVWRMKLKSALGVRRGEKMRVKEALRILQTRSNMENYTEAGCLNEDRRVVEIDDDPEAE